MNNALTLMTVAEAARRIGACRLTLARHITRNGILPDAVLIEGGRRRRSPLFVEPRLAELSKLLNTQPENQS